ncbi:MAG: M12 family metallo-peptidase [Planctomycetota bacterium]|nr:M12 family metallo-peptidase [Planctomycetota bacterium]
MSYSRLIATSVLAAATLAFLANGLKPADDADGGLDIPGLEAWSIESIAVPAELPETCTITVPFQGLNLSMNLWKQSVRSGDFLAIVDSGNNSLSEMQPPAVRTYRGFIDGVPGSRVAASILPTGMSALVWLSETQLVVVQPVTDFRPDLADTETRHVVFESTAAINPGGICANSMLDMRVKNRFEQEQNGGMDTARKDGANGANDGGIAGTSPTICDLVCDTDYEFFLANGSSTTNVVNDVELVVNGMDVVFDRDVNISIEISAVVLRTTSADPYAGTTIGARLNELGTIFSGAPYTLLIDDVLQLFSGYSFSGGTIGVAYLGTVCNQNFNRGVVESRYTTSFNYRVSLSAHELGHNWDATHCDAQGSAACHIMCSANGGCGGISGSNLKFDASTISEVTAYAAGVSCDTVSPTSAAPPFVEDFTSATISTTRWTFNKGGISTTAATGEPSASYSLQLDSADNSDFGDNEIRSARLNLAGLSGYQLSFFTQWSGVESGKSLVAEYMNSSRDWIALGVLTSDGTTQTTFVQRTYTLPTAAHHANLRIRFRTMGDDATDDWYIDNVRVQTPGGVTPPANDICEGAITVSIGATPFNTAGATLDLISVPTSCNEAGAGLVGDVWFQFVGVCDGIARASTCGSVNFDTKILVYAGATCPTASSVLLACDDEGTGCTGGTSSIDFPTTTGAAYWIRIGGRVGTGSGILNMAIVMCPTPCLADISGDGIVNGVDLGIMLAGWGALSGDITGDGTTDGQDLANLMSGFGPCP